MAISGIHTDYFVCIKSERLPFVFEFCQDVTSGFVLGGFLLNSITLHKAVQISVKHLLFIELVSNCLVYPASKSLMTIRHCSLLISSNIGE